jgi:lysophospholipase L1-like esterase
VTTVVVVVLLGSIGTSDSVRPTYQHYVALGDSYTAAPYVPLTDVARGCFRSSHNYPKLVATALRVDDLQDRSCTGARTADLLGRQRMASGRSVPPQLDALSRNTDLVTVGIGANNGHLYARLATICRLTRKICPLYDERATLGRIVDQVGPALVSALQQVRKRSPTARVLLVGYPKLLPQRGDCQRLPRMRPRDRATFRNINLRLRQQMSAAARATGVEFVDFYRASIGHDVCSQHPWIQGRTGNGRQGAALHPLPAGQAALARLVEGILRQPGPQQMAGRSREGAPRGGSGGGSVSG